MKNVSARTSPLNSSYWCDRHRSPSKTWVDHGIARRADNKGPTRREGISQGGGLEIRRLRGPLWHSPLFAGIVGAALVLERGKWRGLCLRGGGLRFTRPVVYLGVAVSLAGISVRRARDAGITAGLGLLVPLLLLADLEVIFLPGNHLLYWPWHLAFGFLCIGALGMLPHRSSNDAFNRDPFVITVWLLAAVIAASTVVKALHAIHAIYFAVGTARLPGSRWLISALLPLALAFIAMTALVLWRTRDEPSIRNVIRQSEEQRRNPPTGSFGVIAILLLGMCATALALRLGDPATMQYLDVPSFLFLLPLIILPTFVIYTLPIWATWRLFATRDPIYVLVVLLTLFPFVSWLRATLVVTV
jgi:hypothetical protein